MSKAPYDDLDYSALRESVASSASNILAAVVDAVAMKPCMVLPSALTKMCSHFFGWQIRRSRLLSYATKIHRQAAKYGSDQTLEEITEILRFGCPEWAHGEECWISRFLSIQISAFMRYGRSFVRLDWTVPNTTTGLRLSGKNVSMQSRKGFGIIAKTHC